MCVIDLKNLDPNRIKRSVQAQYNTEASYIAAQAVNARQGAARAMEEDEKGAADPMAAMERQTAQSKGPAFVAAKDRTTIAQPGETNGTNGVNEDEIRIDDDDL